MNLKELIPEKKKIWTVESEVEASVLEGLLKEEAIPYVFNLCEGGFTGNFQALERGFGFFEVPEEWNTSMDRLFQDFKNSQVVE